MIELKYISNERNPTNFRFDIYRLGKLACIAKFEVLSNDCVRVIFKGMHGEKINNEVAKQVKAMGYKRMVWSAPAENPVTKLATLQRTGGGNNFYVLHF